MKSGKVSPKTPYGERETSGRGAETGIKTLITVHMACIDPILQVYDAAAASAMTDLQAVS